MSTLAWVAILLLQQIHGMPTDRTVLEIIGAKYRSAEELVAIIEPLVAPDGVVTAASGKIIVRANPETIARVKTLLSEIDRPARSLLISVRQRLDLREEERSVSGAIRTDQPPSGAASLGAQSSSSDDKDLLYVRAVEGEPAFIRVGRMEPLAQPVIVAGAGVMQNMQTIQTGKGVHVVPRLTGERVTLEVFASHARFGRGSLPTSREIQSVVSGRMGEWLTLAGTLQSASSSQVSPGAAGQAQMSESYRVYIKVEEVQ